MLAKTHQPTLYMKGHLMAEKKSVPSLLVYLFLIRVHMRGMLLHHKIQQPLREMGGA